MNKNYKILVVDDSQNNRERVSELLKAEGYIVENASGSKKTLQILNNFSPDLFLIDVAIPNVNGLELLKELNVKDNTYEVIMMTGFASLNDAQKAMEYGAFSYISKPIIKEKLYEQVDKALSMVKIKQERLKYFNSLENKVRAQNKKLVETLQILENKDVMMDNIFNSLGEGLLVIDNESNIVFMNAHIQKIIELPFAECAGQSFKKVITDEPLLKQLIDITERKQKDIEHQNHFFIKSTGANENQYYSIYSTDYYNNLGEIIGKIFNFINETGKMKFERLKNSFLTIVSHELRTPLNIIMNYVSLLKLKQGTIENIEEVLDDMEIIGNRLKHQINNVMSIARLTDSSLIPCHEKVDIEELIKLQIEKLKIESLEKNIKIVINNNFKRSYFITDSNVLGIALNCLISNAIKFNQIEGVVRIGLSKKGKNGNLSLSIDISDQGIGIKPEERKHLFESFIQAEDHMTRNFQGIGIGLFLVKRTMDILHGEVSVSSAEGKGSTFTLKIPMESGFNTNDEKN